MNYLKCFILNISLTDKLSHIQQTQFTFSKVSYTFSVMIKKNFKLNNFIEHWIKQIKDRNEN